MASSKLALAGKHQCERQLLTSELRQRDCKKLLLSVSLVSKNSLLAVAVAPGRPSGRN
jgi:hypothetical protein